MKYRFHILGIPHTWTSHEHIACAYTQKILKLCQMLVTNGHTVIHYGNEQSKVPCENVPVTTAQDLVKAYGERKWMSETYKHDINDSCYQTFYHNAIAAIGERKQPGDFLLCMWGHGHKPVADAHKDLIAVEPGIGYAGGWFAKYKAFESYAILHCYLGTAPIGMSHQISWYDVVIPNYFDPADFTFQDKKEDYLLFLGRLTIAKGTDIAVDIAKATGKKLIVAGQIAGYEPPKNDPNIEFVGFADKEKRRHLLANAKAVLMPTMFIEPFGGVHVEAMFSGTPVITTDWGVFTETVQQGKQGYRCRSFQQFVEAVNNIDKIKPQDCRDWAMQNFTMARCNEMYEVLWRMAYDAEHGGGWNSKNNAADLDWLRKGAAA